MHTVPSPFFYYIVQILWVIAVEEQVFSRHRMNEPEGFCMQGLPGNGFEAIPDELFIFCESRAFEDFISSVFFVIKEGMADMPEMGADLVRSPGFE